MHPVLSQKVISSLITLVRPSSDRSYQISFFGPFFLFEEPAVRRFKEDPTRAPQHCISLRDLRAKMQCSLSCTFGWVNVLDVYRNAC